jgi:hypothetical protein
LELISKVRAAADLEALAKASLSPSIDFSIGYVELKDGRDDSHCLKGYVLRRWPRLWERIDAIWEVYCLAIAPGGLGTFPKARPEEEQMEQLRGRALMLDGWIKQYEAVIRRYGLETTDSSEEAAPSLDEEDASILRARENGIFVRTIIQALEFVPPTQADSSTPESHEERLARLRENEALIEENWLAPPRGSAVVYPEPHGRAVRERPTENVRQRLAEEYPVEQCCQNSVVQLAWVGKICELLREPVAERGACDPETERLERFTVGSILNLWRCVIVGRMFLNVWGDELIACREMRSFRCPLGEYPSATRAVQAVAEEVLAELWDTAWKSDPPPGPPYDEDICFAAGCDLPRCRVDWWYGALPALRQRFRALPNRWGLEEESGGQTCWEAGLQQEQAALRQRQHRASQSATDDANAGIQPDSPTADWCLLPGRRVCWEGEPIELQKRLWGLLEYLLTHHSYPLQQGEIEGAVWGEEQEITSKTFANTISRLNTALAAISSPWTWRVSAGKVFHD